MENYKLKEIILDMDKNIYTPITLKQSEVNSTKIKAKLIFNYLEFNPNNITECKVLYNKADSKKVIQDNVSYDSNTSTVEFIIPSQVSTVNGIGEMEIVLYSKENKIISSIIPLKIDRTIFNGIEESIDDWGILDKAFQIAKKADELSIAEEQRKTNEITRITNETDRVTKEKARVSKEAERLNNEIERQNFEIERVTNEDIRKNNENIRVNSENTRISNETKREENEVERTNKENERLSSELDRKNNENTRIEDEAIRSKNETERQDKETKRINNEEDRVNKENIRLTNENTRISSEENRINNESIRVSKESERINAEINRQSNENIRQDGYKKVNEVITNFSVCELYDSSKEYRKFNRVFYNGSTYECILDCKEINPTNKENWICIALKGKDGSGTGDMCKSNYDTNNNGIVDNAEKVNGFTVETNVPVDAKFTDTIYDDSDVKGKINKLGADFDDYKKDYIANNGFGKTSGTANSYELSLSPAPPAYVDGMQITIVPHVDNTTNPTLNINNLGASPILKSNGTAPKEGKIKANKPLSLVRVGSNFFISSSGEYDVGDEIPENHIEKIIKPTGASVLATHYSGMSSELSHISTLGNLITIDVSNKKVVCLDKDSGAVYWEYSNAGIDSHSLLCNNSTGVYLSLTAKVCKLDYGGKQMWESGTNGNIILSMKCDDDCILLGTSDGCWAFYVHTGSFRWRYYAPNNNWVYGVELANGYAYCLPQYSSSLIRLNMSNGTISSSITSLNTHDNGGRWINRINNDLYLTFDSYTGINFQKVSINNGELVAKWSIHLGNNAVTINPILNGLLLVGDIGGGVHLVQPEDGNESFVRDITARGGVLSLDASNSDIIYGVSGGSLVKYKILPSQHTYKILS